MFVGDPLCEVRAGGGSIFECCEQGCLTGTGTAAKMFRHMLSGMAEYESNLISERARAGLEAKKA